MIELRGELADLSERYLDAGKRRDRKTEKIYLDKITLLSGVIAKYGITINGKINEKQAMNAWREYGAKLVE